MKRLFCVVVAVSTVLVGCGGSLCEDAIDATEELEEKVKPCDDGSSTGDDEEYTVEQCEEDIESCSDADQEKLRDFLDCVNDLPTCDPNNPNTFGAAAIACFARLEGVSAACEAVNSESIPRQVYGYSIAR